MSPRLRYRVATLVALAAGASPATALDTQLHGFVAQGGVLSDGNELFGESTEGSIEYAEAGLTGAADLGYGLRASAQFVTRRAGENDQGKSRLDFGFIDYRPLRGVTANAGLRVGKVKNPWGLYNDSRDVVFTRPSILLPDSMYSDVSGQRALLFSSEGAQLYGDWAVGDQLWSLSITGARKDRLDEQEKQKLVALTAPFDLELRDYRLARLMNELGGGRWRLALSALEGVFDLDAPSIALTGEFSVQQLAASAQFNADALTLTAEVVHNGNVSDLYLGGAPYQHQESFFNGGYVQGEYRFGARWAALARYDAMVSRVDGRDCAEQSPPRDDNECASFDATLGGSWHPDPQWGVWAEWHWIDGLFNRISQPDNPDGARDPHWHAFLLMGAYRF